MTAPNLALVAQYAPLVGTLRTLQALPSFIPTSLGAGVNIFQATADTISNFAGIALPPNVTPITVDHAALLAELERMAIRRATVLKVGEANVFQDSAVAVATLASLPAPIAPVNQGK